jgi:hypothetical protein
LIEFTAAYAVETQTVAGVIPAEILLAREG